MENKKIGLQGDCSEKIPIYIKKLHIVWCKPRTINYLCAKCCLAKNGGLRFEGWLGRHKILCTYKTYQTNK